MIIITRMMIMVQLWEVALCAGLRGQQLTGVFESIRWDAQAAPTSVPT